MGLNILIGAFGAHFISNFVSNELFKVYNTGVSYFFYNSLALVGLGVLLNYYKL